MKRILQYCFLAILVLGCKKNSIDDNNGNNNNNNNNNVTPQLYEYPILPSSTNNAITTYNNEHYVYLDTRVTQLNKLFVFLPGTTGTPFFYRLILKKAAALGFHSIGLMYPNNSDIYTAAASSSDNTLFGKCRQEIFDGTDQVSGVSVNVDNCIKNRLIKLIQYLQQNYPTQNWGQFIINGDIDWSKCVIAGHSQGGGHAFYIAKKVSVDRAVSFSSIDWNSSLNRSADWVTMPGETPISKFYSFNGTSDEIFNYANVQTQLNEMSLTGSAISIDNTNPPYSNSHRLITSATPAFGVIFPNHNLTCLDSYVPKNSTGDAAATFQQAWQYLLTN